MPVESETSSEKPHREDRIGKVRGWGDMRHILDSKICPDNERFLHVYFRSQLFIAEGKPTKAKRLFNLLSHWTGFDKFEENPKNQEALSLIDLAVRGDTNRRVTGS
ncbi:MAG TPA: hypothetical protein VJ399_03345 [Patescibacteria group bacterium]|nr:hypothetical protein [Patescibacteria group bacterium]